MYDNYIDKLQISIDQLNSKIDDNISDDSHTLNGSTMNLNDLDSKTEHTDDQCIEDILQISNNVVDHIITKDEVCVKNIVHRDNSVDNIDIESNGATNLLSVSHRDSLESLIENNIHIEADDIDLNSMYLTHQQYAGDNEKDDEKYTKTEITSLTGDSTSKIQERDSCLGLAITGTNEEIVPTRNDTKIVISGNLGKEENRKIVYAEDNLISFDHNNPTCLLDEMVQFNMLNTDCETDTVLEQLYMKEIRFDNGNANLELDSLVLINTEPTATIDFQTPIMCRVPIVEMSPIKLVYMIFVYNISMNIFITSLNVMCI